MKRAVITGLGAVTPLGNNVGDFWTNLIAGKSGAATITKFEASMHKTRFACEVKGFDPLQFLEKPEARKMDLYSQYAIAATEECLRDSALDLTTCNLNKVGVIMATGIGGFTSFEEEILNFGQNGKIPRFNPFFILKVIPNMAAGLISIRYGFRGVSYSMASACTSSNNAIIDALNLIRLGKANVILAGGSEAPISQGAIGGFNSLKALSENNQSPETASRPFDVTRDGFVIGEGAGVLMIEELEHALKRGAKIYCELAGGGCASDAYHMTASHPDGLGAILAMEDALSDAGLVASDVDYINAHATSTPVGDISECKAIKKVFGLSLDKLCVSATKSMTGHLLGAAGAIESIACIMAVKHDVIPPTINCKEVDPEIKGDLHIVFDKLLNKNVQVVLNNTFGFGGHNASSVFKKYC